MTEQRKKFKNTFAPNVVNSEISVDGVIRLLFLGAVNTDNLPPEVLKAVSDEMLRRRTRNEQNG
jgi:hypothetical protein